jgi:hypothetical protein
MSSVTAEHPAIASVDDNGTERITVFDDDTSVIAGHFDPSVTCTGGCIWPPGWPAPVAPPPKPHPRIFWQRAARMRVDGSN